MKKAGQWLVLLLCVGFSVAAGTAPPAGFTCTFELGIAFCQWRHGDGGTTGGKLESLAIEQACAVTVANPAIQVSCIVYE